MRLPVDNEAYAPEFPQGGQCVLIHRQRRGIGLEAADGLHIARAQFLETGRDLFVLRQNHVEG